MLFLSRTDAVLKLISVLGTTNKEAEFLYVCLDSYSVSAIVAQVEALGITMPAIVTKIVSILE